LGVEPVEDESLGVGGEVEGVGAKLLGVFEVDGEDAVGGGAEFEAEAAGLEAEGGADPGDVNKSAETVREGAGGGEETLGEGAGFEGLGVGSEEAGVFALLMASGGGALLFEGIALFAGLHGFEIVFEVVEEAHSP
jgi:hypothetical protein